MTHQFVLILLKTSQNSIESKIVFWYLIAKGDLDFEFVHGATPPLFLITSFEGCSPFLVFMSTFSRHFGTNSKIY
ncbi:MAG TPA: hypothetical protein ENL46_05500 [Candidatus Aminicenantes bacterium]|nr:hypothetical protein [Candidatus Aminicenantes bacterium]